MSDCENDGYSPRRNNLPPEIIADVLSRLPVKSLCLFKCVSPSWNSLISSSYFAKTHFNRTHTNPKKHLLQNIILASTTTDDLYAVNLTANIPFATKLDLPSLRPPEGKWLGVLGSCNGLLLLCHPDTSSFLLNLSTRECKKLPKFPFVPYPSRCFYTCLYGVGYDSSTDDYKVVVPSYYDDELSESKSYAPSGTRFVSVYSLKTNTWRRIQDTMCILEGITISFGVYFHGCLHWVCRRVGKHFIVAFDLVDEIFREVSLPASCVDDGITTYELTVVGDCLCLVERPSDREAKMEVWTMKEYGVGGSWTKIMIEIMTDICGMQLLGLSAENELVISILQPGISQDNLVVYNHQTGMLSDIVVRGIPTKFSVLGTYVESLLPCLS